MSKCNFRRQLPYQAGGEHLSQGPRKIPFVARCLLVISTIFSLLAPPAVSGLSIYDFITLSQNKYKVENIVDIILTTGSAFTLTATDVVYLKYASVDDPVVQAMLIVVPPASQETETDPISNTDWLNVTMEDLLILADNEVSDAVILSFIKTRKRTFTLGASEIEKLREAGLDDVAIQSLLSESKVMDDPVNYDGSPSVSMEYYPPAISTGPYTETVILGRYPSVIPFDVYPRYYYGPSIFIGFSSRNRTLFNHHRAGSHHNGKKHHAGLHPRRDHHIGPHDIGEDQHAGQHHLTPEHNRKYHNVKNRNTQLTSVNKIHSVNNDRNHGITGQSGHKIKKTNRPGIIHNNRQSADHNFNRHILHRKENKSGGSSTATINRNSAHTASKNPTVSRTTLYSTKVGRNYSGRSVNRESKYNRSPNSNQNVKRRRGNVSARFKPR